jgi:hypothetical protein
MSDAGFYMSRWHNAERERDRAIAQANANADAANQWQREANTWHTRALTAEQTLARRDRELIALQDEKAALRQELAKARAEAAGISAKLDLLSSLIPMFGTNALTVFDRTFKEQAPAGTPTRPDTSFAQRAYDKAFQTSLTSAGITLIVKPPQAA